MVRVHGCKVDTDADSLAVCPLSNHDEDEESLELLVAVLAVPVAVIALMSCRYDCTSQVVD